MTRAKWGGGGGRGAAASVRDDICSRCQKAVNFGMHYIYASSMCHGSTLMAQGGKVHVARSKIDVVVCSGLTCRISMAAVLQGQLLLPLKYGWVR